MHDRLGVDICKSFEAELQPLVLRLDERILLELFRFYDACSNNSSQSASELKEHTDDESATEVTALLKAPFFGASSNTVSSSIIFEVLRIKPFTLLASLLTCDNLDPTLLSFKMQRSLGNIVGFQNAAISLDAFMLERPLVPVNVLLDQISKHYRTEVL